MPNLFDARQIVIVHESVWKAMEDWAADHRLDLVKIPDTPESEDDLPSYFFAPKEL